MDFRHHMCCQDCWAFDFYAPDKGRCKIYLSDKNRPSDLIDHKYRHESRIGLDDFEDKWPCEYRYTKEEIKLMKSGKYKAVHVTKDVMLKVMEKVNTTNFDEIPPVIIHRGFGP